MAVTGTPAASLRRVPLFHLLLIVFSLMQKSHTSFLSEQGAAAIPPSYKEMTTSLVVNQLAILQLLQDASNATCVAAEKCGQNEAMLENEASAQAARLEEALRLHLERVEEVVEAGQQHCTQVLDAISTKISTIAQHTLPTVPPPPAPTLRCACDEGWVGLGSSCYYINTARLTWAESRDYCLSRDSDLVKITSGIEDSFIRQHVIDTVFIGLTDQDSEGIFVWTDGSRPEYTAWRDGQPDNYRGIQDCATLWKNDGYRWNDAECSAKLGAVCEKPLKPVPS